MARYLLDHYRVSQRRACRMARMPRGTFNYVSKRPPQEALRKHERKAYYGRRALAEMERLEALDGARLESPLAAGRPAAS